MKALEEMKGRRDSEAPIRIVETSRGTQAYVQVLGFGPGGSSFGFITKSPDGKQDILISMSVSNEGAPCPADSQETHDYYVTVKEHALDLVARAGCRIAETLFKK